MPKHKSVDDFLKHNVEWKNCHTIICNINLSIVIEIRRIVTKAEELMTGREHQFASRVLLMFYFLILVIVRECIFCEK